jgi:hypothetical protein
MKITMAVCVVRPNCAQYWASLVSFRENSYGKRVGNGALTVKFRTDAAGVPGRSCRFPHSR